MVCKKSTNHTCMDILGTNIMIVTMTKIAVATCSLGSSTKVMHSIKFVNWLSQDFKILVYLPCS